MWKEGPKAKEGTQEIILGDTIYQTNILSQETKWTNHEVVYRTLKENHRGCIPYEQDPITAKISANRIHLAPNKMKHRVYIMKHMEKIQLGCD
jgi:hypothetical protein